MSPLTGLLLLSALGLTFAGVYERPEQPWFESQNALSYNMEEDDNARSYMQQDDEAPQPYDNETPTEEEGDNAAIQVHYQNGWDAPLHVDCSPNGGVIFKFQSIHNNHKEDGLWRFDCRHVGRPNNCHWHYGINGWDLPMLFMCPANYYLAGVRSRHDNGREDRIWDARCCRINYKCTRNCRVTGYVNQWDGPLHYSSSGVFAGLLSYHDNGKEDRLWKVIECSLSSC